MSGPTLDARVSGSYERPWVGVDQRQLRYCATNSYSADVRGSQQKKKTPLSMSVIKESLMGGGERAPHIYPPDPGTWG